MKLTERSRLTEVVIAVAKALDDFGIRAVLTGGACASLYTRGAYQSSDLDFVLLAAVPAAKLDDAMASIDFQRAGRHYVHPLTIFIVEFPSGPLAIGADVHVQPIPNRVRRRSVNVLSPTDSCRDRLAAFYFWGDRQSLRTAVTIATRHTVDLGVVRRWSTSEGHLSGFEEFTAELERTRARKRAGR